MLTIIFLILLQQQFPIVSQIYDPKFARFAFEHAAAAYLLKFWLVWQSQKRNLSQVVRYNVISMQHLNLFGWICGICGHSLGGSLAALASGHFAYFYARKRPSVNIQLITFGEPRTGNRDYAIAHDGLVPVSFRIVHRGDLVSHLPSCLINIRTFACSSWFSFGPYHHRFEIWYPENMTEISPFRLCSGQPQNEDQTCSDGYYRHYTIQDHLFYFGEHVSNYGISGCKTSGIKNS